jgi:hypothetical protein
LEELKKVIEKYRERLQEELSRKGQSYDPDRVLKLSCDLDELIVEYEQAVRDVENR